jgi:simple sugar transport system permease protein
MTPLLFAAIGGLFPALTGKLNIALEGLLLAGAFSSLAVFHYTGSLFMAVASAVFFTTVLSFVHVFSAVKLRANLFITGLAVNLFSAGLCVVISDKIFNTRGIIITRNISGLLTPYLVSALILLFVSLLIIYKMPFGYRLRACDKNSEALLSLGVNPQIYQSTAFLISGFFCGIGGSFLSLNLGAFVPGMSAGRGWIALVIIFLGARKPLGILVSAFIFSLIEAFTNYAQGFYQIPVDFIFAFPYIIAFMGMIFLSVNMRHYFKL